MIAERGIVPGKIVGLLKYKKRPVSVTEIKFYLDESAHRINRGICWLVNRGYIRILPREGENYVLYLGDKTLAGSIPESRAYASEACATAGAGI